MPTDKIVEVPVSESLCPRMCVSVRELTMRLAVDFIGPCGSLALLRQERGGPADRPLAANSLDPTQPLRGSFPCGEGCQPAGSLRRVGNPRGAY